MGLDFKTDPKIDDVAQGLNQLALAKKPLNYRFEIVCDPATIGGVYGAIGRSPKDPSRGIVDQVDLKINPQQYEVIEPNRQSVTQTISGAWADFYGLGLPKIVLSGTTGWNPKKRSRSILASNPVLDQSLKSTVSMLKAITGNTTRDTPTGLQDFVAIRNRIHRTYSVLVEKMKINFSKRLQNQLQLRFYAWDTEDYFIVLIDEFKLRRNAAKPMLYDYTIQMTVIGYPWDSNGTNTTDFLLNYFKPEARLSSIYDQLNRFLTAAQTIQSAIASVSNDLSLAIETVGTDVNTLTSALGDVINGVETFVTMPLTATQAIVSTLRSIGVSVAALANAPEQFKNDVRNQFLETECAILALSTYPSLFKPDPISSVYSDVPWANLTCSSSMGLPASPTTGEPGVAVPPAPVSPATAGINPLANLGLPTAPVSVLATNGSPTQPYRRKEVLIVEGDTLEAIIYKNGGLDLNVAQVWQQIATLNDLEYPYIVPNAEFVTEIYATGTVTFSGTPGTVIPSGTRVATVPISGADPIVFDTTAQAVIGSNGIVTVAIRAEQPGDFANVHALSIVQILDLSGATITISGVSSLENQIDTTGGKVFKVLRPGDKLQLPVASDETVAEKVLERTDSNENNLFAIDLKLDATGDLVADGNGDLDTIAGLKNVEAAVLDKLQTDKGELIKHPEYGLHYARMIGEPGDQNAVSLAKIEIQAALTQDPRIKAVQNLFVAKINDSMAADMNLALIDETVKPASATLPV